MSTETLDTTHILIVGGKPVEFPRLSIHQINLACTAITAQKEADARSLSTELKLSNNELFNVIFEIRTRKTTAAELLALCDIPGIAIDICSRSMGESRKPEFAEVVGKMSIGDLQGLAKALVLDLMPERQEPTAEEKKDQAVSPPLPAVDGVSTPKTAMAAGDSTSTHTTIATGKGNIKIPAGYGSNA